MRIKGHPWDAKKQPEGDLVTTRERARAAAAGVSLGERFSIKAKEDGTDSVLEGLFVFKQKKSATWLVQNVVPGATWVPVTFASWEEEVQSFGLFDIAFDHTRCTGADPELAHWIVMLWAQQVLPDQKGKGSCSGKAIDDNSRVYPEGQLFADPLSQTETHALLLMSNPSGQLMYSIEQLRDQNKWPASVPITAVEALRMLQLRIEHWGSFFQVRDALGGARTDYEKHFGADVFERNGLEPLRVLQDIERVLNGQDPAGSSRARPCAAFRNGSDKPVAARRRNVGVRG